MAMFRVPLSQLFDDKSSATTGAYPVRPDAPSYRSGGEAGNRPVLSVMSVRYTYYR